MNNGYEVDARMAEIVQQLNMMAERQPELGEINGFLDELKTLSKWGNYLWPHMSPRIRTIAREWTIAYEFFSGIQHSE